MPGHVRAADAPEDLWRCHECGWTYPNHHPSAKHRRNHKKQCGTLPGFTRTTDLTSDAHVGNGFSDDGSSDEDQRRSPTQGLQENGYHQEHAPCPIQAVLSTVQQLGDSRSNGSSRNDGESHITANIREETGTSTRNLNLPDAKDLHIGNDTGRSNIRSAHAVKGRWTCRHCGWVYPNAHPSAKNRRKHKKICAAGAQHAGAGGSSDEASSDDGIESNGFAGTAELPNGDSSASRLSLGPEVVTEVIAKDTDRFEDVHVEAAAEIARVSSESDSLVLSGAAQLDGVLRVKEEEVPESCESQVAMVEEGSIEPTDEQASVIPETTAIPVQHTEPMKSKQSQIVGDAMKRAESNGVKSSNLDGTDAHQQLLNCTCKQVGLEKPVLQELSQRCAGNDGKQRIRGLERRDSDEGHCQQGAVVHSPERDTKTPQHISALRAENRGESVNAEERSSPGSPEGLVRSRVEIFEKLAGTSPQYVRKSVSPKTNNGSPQLAISSRLQNGTVDAKITGSDSRESARNSQETVSNRWHQQGSERMALFRTKLDAPSELQEVMSHVLHTVNFV